MISQGIYLAFNDIWGLIKLNLIFLVLSFAGGIFLGIGPAFLTISDLITEHRLNSQMITWKSAFKSWRENFKRGNQLFYSFFLVAVILIYNLFLAVQFKGLLWLVLSLFLMFALLIIVLLFLYVINYNSVFDSHLVNLLKLAFISLFMNLLTFIKLLGVVSLVAFLSWKMKGLFVFLTFSSLIFLSYLVIKDQRDNISGKIYEEV